MSDYCLTKEQLEHQIIDVTYNRVGDTGTQCVITLTNGYTVTGESNVIDPTNYDEATGKEAAYENALDKLRVILGYQVKARWHFETQLTVKERVEFELAELDEERTKLAARLESPQGNIRDKQWDLLHKQAEIMTAYALVLQERITEMGFADE